MREGEKYFNKGTIFRHLEYPLGVDMVISQLNYVVEGSIMANPCATQSGLMFFGTIASLD